MENIEHIFIDLEAETALRNNSIGVIELYRDNSDLYSIRRKGLSTENDKINNISEKSLKLMISAGSSWRKFINWYSYFGLFFTESGKDFFSFGFETAVPHKNGAYLINRTYILEMPLSDEMIALFKSKFQPTSENKIRGKVVEVNINDYIDYKETELLILNYALRVCVNMC